MFEFSILTKEKLEGALKNALLKVDKMMEDFPESFPTASSTNGVYGETDNKAGWIQSFYPGMLWLSYELTKDEKYLDAAKKIYEFLPKCGDESGRMFFTVTKDGIIKRTPLDAYKNVRKSGLIALGLKDEDELAWVRLTDGNSQLLVATKNGMAIRFDENDVRPMSRTATGVKAIRLKEDDKVVGMARITDGMTVMTVTDKGQGRRTPAEDYPLQSRHGKGKINYKVNDIKGHVCGI